MKETIIISFCICILLIILTIVTYRKNAHVKKVHEWYEKLDKRTDKLIKINLKLIWQAKEIFDKIVDIDECCGYDCAGNCITYESGNPCHMLQIRDWLRFYESKEVNDAETKK